MVIHLTFYDEIRAADAALIINELQRDPAAAVQVRINSPGGDVHAALAIYNALKVRRPTVYVDGIAASAASVIAMSGHRIIAAENSLLMIHDPWTTVTGNASEMRRQADMLDMHRDALVRTYARTGIAREELVRMLAAETWLSAQDALTWGFVDEIAEAQRYAAHAPTCFSSYQNTPEELLHMRNSSNPGATTPSAPAAPAAHNVAPAPAAAAPSDVITQLRDRNQEIAAYGECWKDRPAVQAIITAALIDPTVTTELVRARVLNALGRDAEPLGSIMYGGPDPVTVSSFSARHSEDSRRADFVAAASDALAIRAGIRIAKPHAGVRDVQGMGLADMMRASLNLQGQYSAGHFSRGELIKATMSTSDFPAILENSLNKALRSGYEAEPATYEAWTRRVLVPDFKAQSRVLLGSAPELLQVHEGGEYTYGSMEDDKSVPYSVKKFGRLVQLTWEALVNDDLGAFLRMTQALGQAAARAEGDAVYNTLLDNSGNGQTMQDANPLFHVSHANIAPSATAITAEALGAARVMLRRQTALGGGALNLPPRFLLVSPEHEQAAEALLAAAARSLSQGEGNQLVPAWLAKLELIVEARLSDDAFFLAASHDAVDTLERAHLEEDNGPRITEEDAFKVDARTYKVRHVFAARWLDWRGVVKGPITG